MPARKNQIINKLPIYIIFLSFVIGIYKFSPIVIKMIKHLSASEETSTTSFVSKKQNTENIDTSDWKEYNNTQYRFVMRVPQLLLERIYPTNGEYELFVKFEQNKFSEDGGVAFGVTKRSVEEEVKQVKTEISKLSDVKPTEAKTKIDGHEAVQLDYPKAINLEERSVVVVNDDITTFSVSTTPEQIEKLKSSINFY